MSLRSLCFAALALIAVTAACLFAYFRAAPALDADLLASCSVSAMGDDERFALGETGKLNGPLSCFLKQGAAGLKTVVLRETSMGAEAQRRATTLLRDDVEFRRGSYAALLNGRGDPRARGAAGDLGVFMEDVAATRVGALSCGFTRIEDVQLVAQLDSLFVLAVAGEQIGVPDVESAKLITSQLLEKAAARVEPLSTSSSDCSEALQTRFRGHLDQWGLFYAGTHPWARGCSATVSDKEFVLRCHQ